MAPVRRSIHRFAALVAGSMLLTLCSCTAVPTWQRGPLVSGPMEEQNELERDYEGHLYQTRESAVGAAGAGGTSCGCN